MCRHSDDILSTAVITQYTIAIWRTRDLELQRDTSDEPHLASLLFQKVLWRFYGSPGHPRPAVLEDAGIPMSVFSAQITGHFLSDKLVWHIHVDLHAVIGGKAVLQERVPPPVELSPSQNQKRYSLLLAARAK
jgi:hypothetical protein